MGRRWRTRGQAEAGHTLFVSGPGLLFGQEVPLLLHPQWVRVVDCETLLGDGHEAAEILVEVGKDEASVGLRWRSLHFSVTFWSCLLIYVLILNFTFQISFDSNIA